MSTVYFSEEPKRYDTCLYCKYAKLKTGGVECRNEESLYFETFRRKSERCPEFKSEVKR